MADIASQSYFILLLSIVMTVLAFPLVFICSFLYELLEKKYENSPKILLMLIVTFIGALIAVIAAEVYAGYALSQLFTP